MRLNVSEKNGKYTPDYFFDLKILLRADAKKLMEELRKNANKNGVCSDPEQILCKLNMSRTVLDLLIQEGLVIQIQETSAVVITDSNQTPRKEKEHG